MSAVRAPHEFSRGANNPEICRADWDRIHELIRDLVRRVPHSGSATLQDEQILIDADIDGARYLLVRLPMPNQAGPSLSPREKEIVRMVSQGLPNKVIAGVLNISSWTVSTHLRRIFAKLGVTSRAAMVAQFLDSYSTPRTSSVGPVSFEFGSSRPK